MVIRRTRVKGGWWPHFLWVDEKDMRNVPVQQFAPLQFDPMKRFPPLIFTGHIKGCDNPTECKYVTKEGGCRFCFRTTDADERSV